MGGTTNEVKAYEFEPYEVEDFAATWGSYMTGGDPGACMYGYDAKGLPQSEEHREDSINWLERCILNVRERPQDYPDHEDGYTEEEKILGLINYLKTAPLHPDSEVD